MNLVERSQVASRASYGDYLPELRWDFWYSCAYCTLSECEAKAISFEIDHFVPKFQGGSDAYDNLMYSCKVCNGHKSKHFPSIELQEDGYRYIRTDEDDPEEHLELTDLSLKPLTKAGEYTIEMLSLNRAFLREIRTLRREYGLALKVIRDGLRHIEESQIDQLDPKTRAWLMKNKASIERLTGEVIQHFREHFQAPVRAAPKEDLAKERRRYLKKLNAIVPVLESSKS